MYLFSCLLLILVWGLIDLSSAFYSSLPSNSKGVQARRFSRSRLDETVSQSIIVVSPPGGVGEVAAVKAACLGKSVRWFVVSRSEGSSVSISPQTLQEISDASGSLSLAGSTVEDLQADAEAIAAVAKWCSSADGIVCSYDGCDSDDEFRSAVLLAAKEASINVNGPRVAILGADEDLEEDNSRNEGMGIGGLVGSMLGNKIEVPTTLNEAMGGNPFTVRHGELFGTPESSPNFSPLEGGPRREPVVAEEYTMRNVRVDPFLVSGNIMASASRRTCRHAVGEVATLLAAGSLKSLSEDISISSQPGLQEWSLDQWEAEFDRVEEIILSGKASTLFSQEMIVDDTERLADWLCTKWAPAVMRTYDIAAIRIGARPVFANRLEDAKVEIVWQELKNYETILVGKMLLEVTKDGLTVTREAGDVKKGYGSISKRPLPGEDVLVRRLADGVSQSIEKGLAKKAPTKKQVKVQSSEAAPLTSLKSAGKIEKEDYKSSDQPVVTGPRTAGARRSTPRNRRGGNQDGST